MPIRTSSERTESIAILTARIYRASKGRMPAAVAFDYARKLSALSFSHGVACEDACGSERAPRGREAEHAAQGERKAGRIERRILALCEEMRHSGGPKRLTAEFQRDPRGVTVLLRGLEGSYAFGVL